MVSGGRLGLALEADVEALRAERAAFLELVSQQSLESIGALLSVAEAVAKSEQAEAALGWLAGWFRDLVIIKVGGDHGRLLNTDRLDDLNRFATKLPLEKILALADFVETMEKGLERNLNKQLMLEGLLLRLRAALQPKAA
jgi:DNA polymerase III gamma/tau subunit